MRVEEKDGKYRMLNKDGTPQQEEWITEADALSLLVMEKVEQFQNEIIDLVVLFPFANLRDQE